MKACNEKKAGARCAQEEEAMGGPKKVRSSMKAVHEALSNFRTAVGAPLCLQPAKTHSFRDLLTSFNSVYYASSSATSSSPSDPCTVSANTASTSTSGSLFSSSSSSSSSYSMESFSRGAINPERFFFNPCISKSITGEPSLEEGLIEEAAAAAVDSALCRRSIPMAMASMDPYRDFRTSMDEMVEAHDLKDWSALQELLQCYLRLNQKSTHSFIFEAFVDLIVHLASQGKIQRSSCSVAPPLAPLHPTPCFGHCP